MSPMPPIEVQTGKPLPCVPRLAIFSLELTVGPYTTPIEHERHVLDTVGSGNWHPSEHDEYRFDKETGELRSLRLRIPERNAEHGVTPVGPPTSSTIRLTERASFDMEPSAARWISPSGDVLTCLYSDNSLPDPIDVLVAPDVHLLVSANRIRGWRLTGPERFLVSGWELPTSDQPDPGLASLLKDFFDLVAEPAIERIEDQDRRMLAALRDLASRIAAHDGVAQRRDALLAKVNDIIDFHYD